MSQLDYFLSNANQTLVTLSSASITPMTCVIKPYAKVEFIKAEVEFLSNNQTAVKYYALFFVDYQAWFEYRRTGMPVLPINAGMVGKQMPTRFKYPIAVRTNNPVNYQLAVTSMGGDDNTTKVWWEK